MMTNRSHHMPMFTKMLAMNITGMEVRAFLNQKICGTSTLQNSIRQIHAAVGPGRPVEEHEPLELVPRVPGDEVLHQVAVGDEHPRGEDDLVHVLQVPHGDDVLEAQEVPGRHHPGHHHGEAGEHGAGHEVGREDRGVPAGDQRHREVEGHDGVDGHHQRRGEAGQQQVADLVVVPVAPEPRQPRAKMP